MKNYTNDLLDANEIADFTSALGLTPSTPTGPRNLSFTAVTGYLTGKHTCAFEIHATGCRDLRKLSATQPSSEFLAPTPKAAIALAIADMLDITDATDYVIQPCCSLNRMRAIGRA